MDDRSGIITLITDFGLQDGYVGAMKGVILGINPQARVVDISHQVLRHNLFQAALMLRTTCPYFPPGSVHLVVVDPGVGGRRKPLLVETERFFLVGPDNGVFFPVLQDHPAIKRVVIENRRYLMPRISDTFHGRDVFAPVAAHCSLGVPTERFGPQTDSCRTIDLPQPEVIEDGLRGQVLSVDGFGNLITNISRHHLQRHVGSAALSIRIGPATISKICRSYQEVPQGVLLAVMGSSELLEIAVNGGSARDLLKAGPGEIVVVRRGSHG